MEETFFSAFVDEMEKIGIAGKALGRILPRAGMVGAAPAKALRRQTATGLQAARGLKSATGIGDPKRLLEQKRQMYSKSMG